MIDEQTPRGFPLPHPSNVAVEDVGRLRVATTLIDSHLSQLETGIGINIDDLYKKLAKQKIETFLGLWN